MCFSSIAAAAFASKRAVRAGKYGYKGLHRSMGCSATLRSHRISVIVIYMSHASSVFEGTMGQRQRETKRLNRLQMASEDFKTMQFIVAYYK